MCGVVGFKGSGSAELLEAMMATLSHRGPDDRGGFFLDTAGLGHTRLSIIDLSDTGHQPMVDESKKIVLAFNGEIYNFKSLRKRLEKKGVIFKGSSDTEVILQMYLLYGEECFEHLDGMFSIAIHDLKKDQVVLARDRFGKKPLFYAVFDNTFIFGSELKAILVHSSCKKEIDIHSLNKYLQYEYVPTPHSMIRGVKKVKPGNYLIYKNGNILETPFWHLQKKEINSNFAASVECVNKLLTKSVSKRLMSDVPLGVFLSGGIDSSAVAYFAAQEIGKDLKTFSIGFEDSSFDESMHALKVAKYLGTDHYNKVVTAEDLKVLIPKLGTIVDEPLADASIVPTYLLSGFTKEQVTVALGGDGGDELFAGYPTFEVDAIGRKVGALPNSFIYLFAAIARLTLPVSEKNFSPRFKANNFFSGFENYKNQHMHQRWLGSFGDTERSKLLTSDRLAQLKNIHVFEDLDVVFEEHKDFDRMNALLLSYLKTYLLDGVLVKVDRASMAHGLEVRAPFLDRELAEYVFSLPFSYKYDGRTTKLLLKKVMEDKLPRDIIYRKKKGFGIPVSKWLRHDLAPLMKETLSKSNLEVTGVFNYSEVERLVSDHIVRKEDNGKKLWTLLMFQLWALEYLS